MAPINLRFGAQPSRFDPSFPRFSKWKVGQPAPPPIPKTIDYTPPEPANLGMMLNNKIGDCTCAAFYHARQVWSFHSSGNVITDPDNNVLQLYTSVSGYDPKAPLDAQGNNPTDVGADEQTVVKYLYSTGAKTGPDGSGLDKIRAFAKVDPKEHDDVKRTIVDCGIAYIAFVIPSSWESTTNLQPAPIWDTKEYGTSKSNDTHAVILTGYDNDGFKLISWGKRFRMTTKFYQAFVSEAYAITDDLWFRATGKTILGLPEHTIAQKMSE
jgi:hypothetical protein